MTLPGSNVANSYRKQLSRLRKAGSKIKAAAATDTESKKRSRAKKFKKLKSVINIPKRHVKFERHVSKKSAPTVKLSIRELADLLYEK